MRQSYRTEQNRTEQNRTEQNRTEQNRTEQNRTGAVDLLRAFGIILMIMGHIGFGSLFDKYIHAFHMPLWFIISGYFVNTGKETTRYILKKIRTLIVPYICFGLIYEIIWTLIGHSQWLGFIYPNDVQIPLNGALWFLPSLFIVDIIGFCAFKYMPRIIAYIVMFMIALLGSFNSAVLPFSIDSAMVGIGFFLIGYLIRKYGARLLDINIFCSFAILVLDVCFIFVNGDVNVRTNTYAVIPLFWFNAVMTIIALWNIGKWIDSKFELKIAKEVGAQSIIYLCLNQFLLAILERIPLPTIIKSFPVLWKVTELIIIVALCFVVNRILLKTPLRIFIGAPIVRNCVKSK